MLLFNKWAGFGQRVPLLLGLIAFLFALFPSDATWVNDDPALIHQALIANTQGSPARSGLMGTFGVPGGPLPIQVYQVMLILTHNPIVLVAVHAITMAVVTGAALLSLGRTLQFPLWYGVLLLLSPWQWLLARSLWDNPLNIPLGTALLAFYAAFLTSRRKKWLIVTIACGLAMSFVHFMSFPLVAAVFLHICFRNFRELKDSRYWLSGLFLAFLIIEAPYLKHIAELLSSRWAAVSPVRPSVAAFFFPLRGAWLFTGEDFPVDMDFLVDVSLIAYPLVWIGIAAAIVSCVSMRKSDSSVPVRDTIVRISLVTLVLQMSYYGILGVMPLRHYFNATHVVFAIFAWLAVANMRPKSVQLLAGGLHGIAMLGIVAYLAVTVHITGSFGTAPTLGVQRRVAHELARYSNTTALTDIDFFKMYPHCLWALAELEGLSKGTVRAEHLVVHKLESDKGSIVVDTKPPADSAELAVLPLSGDIHPR
jgi:hypothetical protein